MNKTQYGQWLQQANQLNGSDAAQLLELAKEYPYCQTTQLLYVKSLHNEDSIRFNKQLRIAAAYAGDRQQLFYLITEKNKRHKEQAVTVKPKKEKPVTIAETKEQLNIGQPLQFQEEEKHSFSEWLKLSQAKPIVRQEEPKEKSLADKLDLIETFVAKERPKPQKEDFFSPSKQAKQSVKEQMTFVTETLARVYLEQEHYGKAKAAYQQLSLKYPEKSSFFAAQIELIEELIKDK
tara:strand:+ start:105 stop:809 length:705 start_codon:yes stop_codon:yes gene_type:complete